MSQDQEELERRNMPPSQEEQEPTPWRTTTPTDPPTPPQTTLLRRLLSTLPTLPTLPPITFLSSLKKPTHHPLTTPPPTSRSTIYLGNVITTWAKGPGSLSRPAAALWKNHQQGRGSIKMLLSVTNSGLKAQTREHGVTEYWANRLTWCGVPGEVGGGGGGSGNGSSSRRVFCWVYRHEGRKLKQELRCHAVLCKSESEAKRLEEALKMTLSTALYEWRRERRERERRRIGLGFQEICGDQSMDREGEGEEEGGEKGGYIYKVPLERSKSAPKLGCIREEFEGGCCFLGVVEEGKKKLTLSRSNPLPGEEDCPVFQEEENEEEEKEEKQQPPPQIDTLSSSSSESGYSEEIEEEEGDEEDSSKRRSKWNNASNPASTTTLVLFDNVLALEI